MAIDHGDARVGIALTDPLQIISSAFKTLKSDNDLMRNIKNICIEKEVESIVIGIPFDQNSEVGKSAKKVLIFAKELIDYLNKNKLKLEFYEQDERYSTMNAIDAMKEINVRKKRKKQVVDQIAAASILSDFMKKRNKKKLDILNYL